jgi:hypothetical protein
MKKIQHNLKHDKILIDLSDCPGRERRLIMVLSAMVKRSAAKKERSLQEDEATDHDLEQSSKGTGDV